MATFFQMTEPKIIETAIDAAILPHLSGRPVFGDSTGMLPYLIRITGWDYAHTLSGALAFLGLLYFILGLFKVFLNFVSTWLVTLATESAMRSFREKLFLHIQKLPLRFHHAFNRGELIQRCTGDIETLKKFYYEQVVECIRLSGLFISAFYFMWQIHWPYSLIAILLMPVIIYNASLFFVKEKKIWAEHEAASDRLTHLLNENLNGLRVVKAFGNEESEIARFQARNEEKYQQGLRHIKLHSWFWPFSDFFVHLQFVMSALAGGYFVLTGAISPGELAGFYIYAVIVSWPLREIGRIVSQYGMAKIALQRLEEIVIEKEEENTGTYFPAQLRGDIRFDKVSFTYPGENRKALDALSFEIKAGQKIAFIGPTGGGKSTLIYLLLHFYKPDSGKIWLDGKPLEVYDTAFLRSRIGAVFQEAFLFSDTIAANILTGKKDQSARSFDDIIAISKTDTTITLLERGVDTLVGEKGIALSGGQKQRVALARTLMQEPDILFLDDTTSAVDNDTEYEIQAQIVKNYENKTLIYISNRIQPVQNCDCIFVVQKGKIIEEGTPDSLLHTGGYYSRIAAIQMQVETEILAEIYNQKNRP